MPNTDASDAAGRPIDAAALSKLRWRCRRGLLENDLLLDRYFRSTPAVPQAHADGLHALMQLDDPLLLDLFLGRQEPGGALDRPEVLQVLEAVRAGGDGLASNPPQRITS